MTEETEIEILDNYRNIAMVGVSPRPDRPSYGVAAYLIEHGYNVIPVNPIATEILGRKCYPDLESVPEPVEVVDVFRRPKDALEIAEQAIKIGAKALWLQEGVINEEAAARAREAGLLVVMDHCMFKEHSRLTEEGRLRAS
jgi:predicted CoA-binding protein